MLRLIYFVFFFFYFHEYVLSCELLQLYIVLYAFQCGSSFIISDGRFSEIKETQLLPYYFIIE